MSATPHTVEELLARVRRLPAVTPQASALPLDPRYETFQAQWVGWLEEYDGPGYYDRGNGERDARWAYQHLNNGRMIVWLNEAAGRDPCIIQEAIVAMADRDPPQTKAKHARLVLPWERVAKLLFDHGRGTSTDESSDRPDLVDVHFRPFVRALGNLNAGWRNRIDRLCRRDEQ